MTAPSIEDARRMGEVGGPAVEAERLAFEAWMAGHCWALCATWTGTEYRSDLEQCGSVDLQAMSTRRLWAAWRDRAALAAPAVPHGWVPAHERVPAPGTECVVLVRYTLDRPPFCTVDKWDIQREDPIGMGGPTIETGEGWNDNCDGDVIAWFPVPPHPPAEWDQRLAAAPTPQQEPAK